MPSRLSWDDFHFELIYSCITAIATDHPPIRLQQKSTKFDLYSRENAPVLFKSALLQILVLVRVVVRLHLAGGMPEHVCGVEGVQ